MFDMVCITDIELDILIDNAIILGVTIGMLIGIYLVLLFAYAMVIVNKKNFKMYLLQLDDTEKHIIISDLNILQTTLDNLSKTNTRYFKKLYNEICELKTYLKLKWMQN